MSPARAAGGPSRHPAAVADLPSRLGVVVADDHPLFRAGIVRALGEDGRFTVVGEAADGAEAERLIHEHCPEIALLDLRMPVADALQVTARLRHSEPTVAVVVLTAYTDTSLVHSLMAAGAAGYVAKETDRQKIVEVLIDAASGRRRVVTGTPGGEAADPRPRLSARERSVLSMLNRGWAPEEIAMIGNMTLKTVQIHVANARRKLGASTTADAIAAAEAWQLLS
jgi:two-component system, NarL family, nitrate/nitrite response regulator NarL